MKILGLLRTETNSSQAPAATVRRSTVRALTMLSHVLTFTVLLILATVSVQAHPGSGIIIDSAGNLYFTDTGSGIYRIGRDGKLERVAGQAFHWMALDQRGHFSRFAFKDGFERVTPEGTHPAVLTASDFSFVVADDGSLFYGWQTITRMTPDGKTSAFRSEPDGVTGMALGPGGALYVTTATDRLAKIDRDGKATVIVSKVTVPNCSADVPEDTNPSLRGLAVDATGNVYVAASGCRAVVKITHKGRVETILKAEAPWSPTGVALFGKTLYVLEYTRTPGDNRREWIPRIRKISPDGKVSVVTVIERK